MNKNSETMISGQVAFGGASSLYNLGKDAVQAQNGFGGRTTYGIKNSPESVDDHDLESSVWNGNHSFTYPIIDNRHPSPLGQIFNITDISPAWALSTEETKVLFYVTAYLTILVSSVRHFQ